MTHPPSLHPQRPLSLSFPLSCRIRLPSRSADTLSFAEMTPFEQDICVFEIFGALLFQKRGRTRVVASNNIDDAHGIGRSRHWWHHGIDGTERLNGKLGPDGGLVEGTEGKG